MSPQPTRLHLMFCDLRMSLLMLDPKETCKSPPVAIASPHLYLCESQAIANSMLHVGRLRFVYLQGHCCNQPCSEGDHNSKCQFHMQAHMNQWWPQAPSTRYRSTLVFLQRCNSSSRALYHPMLGSRIGPKENCDVAICARRQDSSCLACGVA